MSASVIRYHITLNSHKTTISLDKIVSHLMAIKLGATPRTRQWHSVVRKQLELFVAHDLGRSGRGLSRYINEQSILFIADTILSEKYWECWEEIHDMSI